VAHIAFSYYAALWIELWDGIGAVPNTVLATDTGVGGVQHNSCDRVLFIGIDRAATHTVRGKAVVASHREIVTYGLRPGASFDLADATPAKISRIAVLLVAGDLAGAASDAFGHIEVKAILFAGLEWP
jgi:hypothetical protein